MATYLEEPDIIYINPDGSYGTHFNSHDEAEAFWDFGTYLLPYEWY